MLDTTTSWVPIPGWEDLYLVSSDGHIWSNRAGRKLKPGATNDGHLQVKLCRNGESIARLVHVIVMEVFVSPRPDGMEACHIDGDPSNNSIGNLRWDTSSANSLDSVLHGTHNMARKTHCPQGHEYNEANTGHWGNRRRCRVCDRDRARHRRAMKNIRTGAA